MRDVRASHDILLILSCDNNDNKKSPISAPASADWVGELSTCYLYASGSMPILGSIPAAADEQFDDLGNRIISQASRGPGTLIRE